MTTNAATVERKDADSRRREIADAALKIIAEHGLAHFTALAIAREIGLTDAALFRHFSTKEAIVLAAIARVEEHLLPLFPEETGDPLDRLGRFFEARVGVIREHPGIARLVASEQLAQAAPPEGVERVHSLRRRSGAFVRRCLDEAVANGTLAEGVEPDVAATLVLGAILALTQGAAPAGKLGPWLPTRVWQALEAILRRKTAAHPHDRTPGRAHPRRKP